MAKENLFENIGLEDARRRLQEVSEYMDKVIRRRGMRAEWDRKDVTKDDMWNLAHDVLEITHTETLEDKCDLHLTGVLTGSSIEKNPINIHIHGDVYNLDDFKNKVEEALREHVRQVNKAIERTFEPRRRSRG